MPKNRLQTLYHLLDREITRSIKHFQETDALRLQTRNQLSKLKTELLKQIQFLKSMPDTRTIARLKNSLLLIDSLLAEEEKSSRTYRALDFNLNRMQKGLAHEFIRPKLYAKLEKHYEASQAEKNELAELIASSRKKRVYRLLCIEIGTLHFAIPIQKLLFKRAYSKNLIQQLKLKHTIEARPVLHPEVEPLKIVAFEDLEGGTRFVRCTQIYDGISIESRSLRNRVEYDPITVGRKPDFRGFIRLYGKRFFLYGLRQNYKIHHGDTSHAYSG